MKKVFKICGIDCAACAADLERAINKLPEVKEAKISFITEKLTVEADDLQFDGAMEKVRSLVKKKEPDAAIKD